MKKSKKTQEQFLLEQLERMGLPLEMQVSIALEKKNWVVMDQDIYLDQEEGKTREIDVLGIKFGEVTYQLVGKKSPFQVSTDIALECKKGESNAWIFLTRPSYSMGVFLTMPNIGTGQTTDFLSALSRGKTSFIGEIGLPKLHYEKYERISHIGADIKLDGTKGRDELFEARSQLTKYSDHFLNEAEKRMSDDINAKECLFLFLAVVFDGQLYEAHLERGKLRLEKVARTLLACSRISKSGKDSKNYLIDIVQKDSLSEYLKMIEKDIDALRTMFRVKKEKLLTQADQAVETLSKYSAES